MAGKIIVAGHICLDITPVFPEEKSQPLSKVLIPGKLIQTKAVNVNTGGAVANTGLALKFFGADVSLMGKIGADEFGAIIEKKLRTHGAQDGLIVSPGESTSYSIVIAPPGTDRIFCTIRGQMKPLLLKIWILRKSRRQSCFILAIPLLCTVCTGRTAGSWKRCSRG